MAKQLPQIFLDCDGVLADFDGEAKRLLGGIDARAFEKEHGAGRMWAKVYAKYDFFLELEKLEGSDLLVDAIRSYGVTPKILTGLPSGGLKQAKEQKIAWGEKHFPGIELITCMSRDKCKYALPRDIIIDDWGKWQHKWEEVGGVWIMHTSVENSLKELDQHMKANYSC